MTPNVDGALVLQFETAAQVQEQLKLVFRVKLHQKRRALFTCALLIVSG